MEFLARITQHRGLDFGDRNAAIFRRYMAENPGIVLKITPVLPESGKQRRFLEGAVIPLVTFYQEGMDHHDGNDRHRVREWLKEELNGEMVELGGKVHRIAKTTKGRDQLQPFLERVLAWVMENYEPPPEALNPEAYRVWRDTIFPYGGPDNYIDYLRDVRHLIGGL
jgi:hypothetical protein